MYVPTTAPLVPLTGLTGLRTGLSAQRVQQLVAVIPCPPEIESLGYEVGNGACVGAAVVGAIEIRRLTQEGMQRSVSRASPSMEKMAIFYSVCRKSALGAVGVATVTLLYRGVPLLLMEEPCLLSRPQATAVAFGPMCGLAAAALPNIERRQRLRGSAVALLGGALLGAGVGYAETEMGQWLRSNQPAEPQPSQGVGWAAARTGAVAGALGSIFAATVVPSHAPVYRAKAAGVGMVAGGLVGVLVELTTPPERRGDAYLEASRVRPGWLTELRATVAASGSPQPVAVAPAPVVDSVAISIAKLSLLESGLDILDMGELRKLQQTLQETLRAQREQAAGDDHVAATQRQVQRVEQRIQLLKRHAPGRRWWRWW